MEQVIEFVGVILEDMSKRVALQLREETRALNPDMWSVFGGHIEENETPRVAATREIEEELSVRLDLEKSHYLGKFEHEEYVFHIFHYLVKDELDQAILREGQTWRWFSLEEIRNGESKGKKIVSYHAEFLLQLFEKRKISENEVNLGE